MLYRYWKGGVIAREIVASRAQAPPTFCTEAKVAKGGVYLRDSTVYICVHIYIYIYIYIIYIYTVPRCYLFMKECEVPTVYNEVVPHPVQREK